MQFDFCYNVDKYIESLGDLTSMHLSDILVEHAYANKRCTRLFKTLFITVL